MRLALLLCPVAVPQFFSIVSKSRNVFPSLSFHSVNPLEFRPSTIEEAADGLLNIKSSGNSYTSSDFFKMPSLISLFRRVTKFWVIDATVSPVAFDPLNTTKPSDVGSP